MLIARLVRLPAPRLRLLAEAGWGLLIAAVATRLLSFPKAMAFGRGALGRRDRASVEDVVWSVRAMAARAPFRAVCLQQALALQRMLRRRGWGATLHYGIAAGDRLEAHAWVSLDGKLILGGDEAPRFQEVASWP